MNSNRFAGMKTTLPLALAVLLLLSPAAARGQRAWTLDECMDYAIAHNTEMEHLQNEQKRREVKVQADRDARLPRFYGDLGGYVGTLRHSGHINSLFGKDDTSKNRFDANESLLSMGLNGVLPLYTGSRLSSQVKADKYSLLAAEQDVHSARKNLKIQVAAAFLQVLYDKGEEKIARERLDVSRMLLTRAQSLYDKGRRPESDVAEATAMVSRDEALLTAAEGNVAMAILDLRLLINLTDSTDFDICETTNQLSDSLPPRGTEGGAHPAVHSAGYTILQAEQAVKTARSGYYPTLSLVGSLSTLWGSLSTDASYRGQLPLLIPFDQSRAFGYALSSDAKWKRTSFLNAMVGLKLTIPLFDAFETKARIRTAKINLEDARLAYDDARQRVEKDISQAWQGAVTARKRYEAEVKAEEAGALAYRYALKRYDAGMATLFDLSQSRQQWFAASENALRMKYEYLIRERILDIHTREESPLAP